jgi:hypothetical protein
MTEIAARGTLPELQQLLGQTRRSGAGWQNLYLGVEHALSGIHVASIFYDQEMIRFALSLPLDLKYRNGETKFFLRQLLAEETGIRIPGKRAAPNPMRLWMFAPNCGAYVHVVAPLRPVMRRLMMENWRTLGALYQQMLRVLGLGLWMQAQEAQVSRPGGI